MQLLKTLDQIKELLDAEGFGQVMDVRKGSQSVRYVLLSSENNDR
jgi:hypothetical protein